ncbi:TPA: hypothetical protein ACKP4Z_004712 [Pseudomonas aeruginosa]|uniref:hypothetical protein n=4 Tax=Pseudomonas aeruginosa TaxID=287 RepID=UPI0023B2F6D4|nr:hypothetical protein [Pseudomonas aeruginosa]MDE9778161.1 hypothetical protein [Pseudomonas aeruginosa]
MIPLESPHQGPTPAPAASWVLPLATLRQDQASAPSTSWVVPLAPLHQEPTSAPVASWVVPLEPLHQELTSAPVAAINFSHPIGTEKMCDSIVYAPMDELEFERLLGLATLFNDNDEWPIDFTELQELSELLGKLKSCVDVAIDNAPEGAKS